MSRYKLCFALVLISAMAGARADGLSVTSAAFKTGAMLALAQVFNGNGCTGRNLSPPLQWTPGPAGTKSYAITLFDPDAGGGWWHWTVYNIPAAVTSLPEGAGDASGARLPAGAAQGRNDFGDPGYGGACPPPGDKPHRYVLSVHALKVEKLALPPGAGGREVDAAAATNTLAKAGITARYGR